MVRLLEMEPELGEQLSPEERRLVSPVAVPIHTLSAGDVDIDEALSAAGAFAAFILDGVLLHRMAIGQQPGLRLLGRGDLLPRSGGLRTGLLSESTYRATCPIRLAMLDDRVLLAARRFPRLFSALQVRAAEEHQRLAAQLVICQLPRVEDRLLALMWLLAETWGRVTPSGTVVPVSLTHDALGEMIGARRPTITLALKELAQRGSLFRQDGEWLLLEPPPEGVAPPVKGEPQVVATTPTGWSAPPPAPYPPQRTVDQLVGVIAALRESHARNADDTSSRLARARRTRERSRSLRQRITDQRLSRRWAASGRRPAP